MNRLLMHTLTLLLVLFSFMSGFFSCINNEVNTFSNGKGIKLDVQNDSFVECIKEISPLPLCVDEDWLIFDNVNMAVTSDRYFFINTRSYHIASFDHRGNKIFCKQIRGRRRGEILSYGNFFPHGDSICIYDQASGLLPLYDTNGSFCGILNDKRIDAEVVYPVANKYVALSYSGASLSDRHYVTIYNNNFERIRSELEIPDYLYDNYLTVGDRHLSNVEDDTLRFMLNLDYKFYTITPDSFFCSYHFITQNAIPDGFFPKKRIKEFSNLLQQVENNGYASFFENICESDNYIILNYHVNRKRILTFINKKNEQVYSIELPKKVRDLEGHVIPNLSLKYLLLNSVPLCTNGDYLYLSVRKNIVEIIETIKDETDTVINDFVTKCKEYTSFEKIDEEDTMFYRIQLKV